MHKIIKALTFSLLLACPIFSQAKSSRARLVATGTLKLLGSLPILSLAIHEAYKLPYTDWNVVEAQSQDTLEGQPSTTFHKIAYSIGRGSATAYIGSVGAYLAHRGIKDLKKAFTAEEKPKKKKKKKSMIHQEEDNA